MADAASIMLSDIRSALTNIQLGGTLGLGEFGITHPGPRVPCACTKNIEEEHEDVHMHRSHGLSTRTLLLSKQFYDFSILAYP